VAVGFPHQATELVEFLFLAVGGVDWVSFAGTAIRKHHNLEQTRAMISGNELKKNPVSLEMKGMKSLLGRS
ncbi:hypothetical protein LINPERPRIM_LOCUS11907, partial [Linum perenne]